MSTDMQANTHFLLSPLSGMSPYATTFNLNYVYGYLGRDIRSNNHFYAQLVGKERCKSNRTYLFFYI
jgi:hypothetical protein